MPRLGGSVVCRGGAATAATPSQQRTGSQTRPHIARPANCQLPMAQYKMHAGNARQERVAYEQSTSRSAVLRPCCTRGVPKGSAHAIWLTQPRMPFGHAHATLLARAYYVRHDTFAGRKTHTHGTGSAETRTRKKKGRAGERCSHESPRMTKT